MRTLRSAGRATFFALVERLDRPAIIVTFLAILELVRRGRVGFAQPEAFEDIELLLPAAA
jgi:chromatin segregation and condensation protein Rec8/ScpA/Scc1 (kleisin family)